MVTIRHERPSDVDAREALLDAAFGPARFAKTPSGCAKAGCRPTGLSLRRDRRRPLVGTVRLWHVSAGGRPALLLGPLAVASGLPQSRALARALMQRALSRDARRRGHRRDAAGRRRALLRAASASRRGRPRACGCPGRSSAHRFLASSSARRARRRAAGLVRAPDAAPRRSRGSRRRAVPRAAGSDCHTPLDLVCHVTRTCTARDGRPDLPAGRHSVCAASHCAADRS